MAQLSLHVTSEDGTCRDEVCVFLQEGGSSLEHEDGLECWFEGEIEIYIEEYIGYVRLTNVVEADGKCFIKDRNGKLGLLLAPPMVHLKLVDSVGQSKSAFVFLCSPQKFSA